MKKTYIFAIIASLALLFGCSVHGSGGEGTFTEKKVSPAGTQLATKGVRFRLRPKLPVLLFCVQHQATKNGLRL